MSENPEFKAQENKRSIKDLVNTPFKKIMLGIQLLSYLLIVGSPIMGAWIAKTFDFKVATGILVVFIAGEVLFYGSLFFLGKEVYLLLKEKMKGWFTRKRAKN